MAYEQMVSIRLWCDNCGAMVRLFVPKSLHDMAEDGGYATGQVLVDSKYGPNSLEGNEWVASDEKTFCCEECRGAYRARKICPLGYRGDVDWTARELRGALDELQRRYDQKMEKEIS